MEVDGSHVKSVTTVVSVVTLWAEGTGLDMGGGIGGVYDFPPEHG